MHARCTFKECWYEPLLLYMTQCWGNPLLNCPLISWLAAVWVLPLKLVAIARNQAIISTPVMMGNAPRVKWSKVSPSHHHPHLIGG